MVTTKEAMAAYGKLVAKQPITQEEMDIIVEYGRERFTPASNENVV